MHKKFNISTADSKREKKNKKLFPTFRPPPPTFTLIYTEDELHLYKS